MSRVLRKSKTKEKVGAQFGVADLNPADLDVRQTRHSQYRALPPSTGGTWRERVQSRQRSESPEFISTTPDAMSTDEAIEISKKIDTEVEKEKLDRVEITAGPTLGLDDTLPTVEELQAPRLTEEHYEEIEDESSGVVTFPQLKEALKGKEQGEVPDKSPLGARAPLATAPEIDLLYKITPIPSLTYGDGPDFDKIIQEGDEFIEKTYSVMEAPHEEEERSQSFVILERGNQEVPSSIYETLTQELRQIMPNEIYLPTSKDRTVSGRKPKLWVRQTPFEGNPAVIVKIEEWLKEVGTADYAVDVQLGIIYAIRGSKWEKMPVTAKVSTKGVEKGTPVMGPIDKTVKTPISQEPIPVAESTRKEVPSYVNETTQNQEVQPPDPESLPRPSIDDTPIQKEPRVRLEFEQRSDDEDQQIQEEIEEARMAEEALAIQRQEIEVERQRLLREQQQAAKERLITLRQQRKKLEESIAEMTKEIAADSKLPYGDRLNRRQNLVNEYSNQIDREEQLVEDFIEKTDEPKEITLETMTTDSTLSSTADPIDFLDETSMMKIKIKKIRAEQCKSRSVVMYKHFIKKAKELKHTKEQEELENLMIATMKSLDKKVRKYQRVLDSYDTREKQYFEALEQNNYEEIKRQEKKQKKEKEIAELQRKHLATKMQVERMRKLEQAAQQRKEVMELRIKEEKERQLEKVKQLAEEKEKLKRLQRQKEEEALTEAYLLKEQQIAEEDVVNLPQTSLEQAQLKEQQIQEELTEQFLAEERLKEEEKQRILTLKLLEKERLEEERMMKAKAARKIPSQGASPNLRIGDHRKRPHKPSASEQEAERQKLFDTLNEVVKNGQKPSKEKELRWDYEQDRKAQAIFGKMRKPSKTFMEKCPKCGDPKHEGDCPCILCGRKGHNEDNCPTNSPPHKRKKEKPTPKKKDEICSCCKTKGHKAQECPWNKDETMDIEVELAMEKPYATICTHCRALDHMIEDCPALMDADKRRRKVACERCGKQGHDVTACLDETELEKEKKIREAIQKKTKELEAIEVKIRKLKKTSGESNEPQDRDINTPSSFRGRTSTGRGDSDKPPREPRDQYSRGPQTPRDANLGREPAGGAGGGPPDDPGDDDGDEGEDDNDDENEEEETDEDDEQSEMSEDSELSDFLYDIKGNKIDIGQLFQEWQNSKENKPPVRIVRGPRGHRGARGKPGRKGPKGDDSPIRNLTDSGFATNNVSLNTSGLEDSFKELGNSMKNVWTVQRDLNTSMRDHIQITAQAQQKNTEALERLNESTRQRDHDHMFVTIEAYDGTDPEKFDHWIEQIEIACRISGRDPRVVALAKSTGAVTEVIRSMRPGLSWVEFKNELKRCFSASKSMTHAALILDNFRKQNVNENLRSYIHKYTKLHREATDRSCEDEYDTKAKLHFLSRLRNGNIATKISQSADFEKYKTYSLQKCMEKALVLESRLQVREMVTQAREAVDATKPTEIMEVEGQMMEEEVNNIPDASPVNRSKANSICYKCGEYGHYGRECPSADQDLEDIADRIVGRIEHTFQAYTPVTLQYMNDIIAKAAKIDQSRRVAKTKARLLQGLLNQRGGGAQTTPKAYRGRGRGAQRGNNPQLAQPQGPPVGRGRGRGAANTVAKRTRQLNQTAVAPAPVQPSAPPLPNVSQTQDPIKVEPNPFLGTTNPFLTTDSHLPEINELQDEIDTEELENMTLKELEALQQTLDEGLEEGEEEQLVEKEQ